MKDFDLSNHAAARMSQRGFKLSDLSFVLERGTELDGGVILTNEDVEAIEREAKGAIELARKLKGTFLPCEAGMIKTVFKASKVQQSRFL